MEVLVKKFGGTSVSSYEKMTEVCNIIKKSKQDYEHIVVVVSAMGRSGDPYATDTLISLCKNVNDNPSKRELDLIMSCGEVISGTILATMLKSKDIDAVFLTGAQAGIITDNEFSNSKIINIKPARIYEELQRDKVVVIAGFQGQTVDGEITTLGRGGSDTSAVAIGKALKSEIVEIYTDVDGIMTADPRIVPEAKVLNSIEYEEVFQMADKGAKVIHPRAVKLARSSNITLNIKNTLNPNYEGTKISNTENLSKSKNQYETENKSRLFTAVAHKEKLAQIKIKVGEDEFIEILNNLENKKISIDMINFFVDEKAFVVDESDLYDIEEILNNKNVNYSINKGCSKVTLISTKITGEPGVMAKVVRSLSKAGIPLLQTSDSNMTISCLVNQNQMRNAIKSIHKEFYVE